jgi:hypothetical protein
MKGGLIVADFGSDDKHKKAASSGGLFSLFDRE